MPRSAIHAKVAPDLDTENALPEKNGLDTISGGLQAPALPAKEFHDDTPVHMRYRGKVSWWSILYKSVPDGIGIGGMKYAFNPSELKWRRISWLILVMGAFGALSYQVIDRARYYASTPKSVDVSINYTDSIMFPTVAICNYNTFKGSHLYGTEMGDFLQAYVIAPADVNLTQYYDLLSSNNMSTLITNHGPTIEETIFYATFMSVPLTKNNFTVKLTGWGLCFMFNDAGSGHPPLSVKRAGKKYGLDMTLDVRQSQYFFSHYQRFSAGFQIIIYEYGTEPLIEDHGFGISPGTHSLVGIEVTEVNNLKLPDPTDGGCEEKELQYFDRYGYAECAVECKTDFFIDTCGCRIYATRGSVRECNNWEYFSCLEEGAFGKKVHELVHGKQDKVSISLSDKFVANHTCNCPVPCRIRTYKPILSTTKFPSTFWANVFADLYPYPNLNYYEDNLCLITIYFQEMSIQQITQQRDYNLLSLLCDIGGSLVLWLGGSILTMFEFLDLLSNSIYVYTKRVQRRR